ncbi:hypothetical protein [Streptomyces sp. NPDC088258]|uniref:hypothetical protein n=1 Tax=Streptomyces sp. NPDC088258 TaxID=3365849 RepID=UPI00381829BC
MTDFQGGTVGDRPYGRPDQGAAAGTSAGGVVHQVVFRWDGNHGRQSTGMKAVSHSCSAERAEELGRELGPLLWVSGTQGLRRPSFVRTFSRDGNVMLAQRWPTTDRGGRPSTVSNVLIGDAAILKTRLCLGLASGGWAYQEKTEKAEGEQRPLTAEDLETTARKRLPGMRELLPAVRNTLILVTAEWLRDPAQRISLLTDEVRLPDGVRLPDRTHQDAAPLVYLGLFLLFGPWLGREWTFATYDTVDTHPLRLTCVPRWEPDAGESGPLARVIGRMSDTPRREHEWAVRLVDHVLAYPTAGPGVPQLVQELPDGAALDWARRREALGRILSTTRRPVAPAQRPASEPPPPPAPEPYPEPRRAAPPPVSPPPAAAPAAYDEPTLREDLRAYRRADAARGDRPADRLPERLRGLSDERLVAELCRAAVESDAVELLLRELSDPDRRRVREDDVRHRICAEVLRNDLYLTRNGPSTGLLSRPEATRRAADLFNWAVAPLARDGRYLADLRELLHRMSRDRRPAAADWLQWTIVQPVDGVAPDLPPALWQQILRDVMSRNTTQPSAVPPTTAPPSVASPVPPPVAAPPATPTVRRPPVNLRPAPPPTRTPPPTLAKRLSDLANSPGCVIGVAAALIAGFITAVFLLL